MAVDVAFLYGFIAGFVLLHVVYLAAGGLLGVAVDWLRVRRVLSAARADGLVDCGLVFDHPCLPWHVDGVSAGMCGARLVAVRYRVTNRGGAVAHVRPGFFAVAQHGVVLEGVCLDGGGRASRGCDLLPGGSVTLVQVFRAADRSPLLVTPVDGGVEGFTVPWFGEDMEVHDGE